MRTPFSHVIAHVSQYGRSHRTLYYIALSLFFIRLFDGILAYAVPLLITELGFSKTQMGVIIGFSSLAGAAFDIFLVRILKSVTYKRVFLLLFAAALGYSLLLWSASTLVVFLFAMALWGIYFDFMNFGTFNFIAHELPTREHSSGFGVIDVFKSLGYLIAPLLSGLVIVDRVTNHTFIFALIFLGIGFVFYLVIATDRHHVSKTPSVKSEKRNLFQQLASWKTVGYRLMPMLLMTIVMNTTDAFFWTLGPLISESLTAIHPFGGFMITLYFLPNLFMSWFAGPITNKFGKKRTAMFSFLSGSIILSMVYFVGLSPLLLVFVFISSVMSSIAWPAMNGAYADYIAETPSLGADIEGVTDFSYNIAYVIGPIIAGFASDTIGDISALSLVGLIGIGFSLLIIRIMPAHIRIQAT